MKKKLFTIIFSALSFMPFFANANESDYLYSTLCFQKAQEYKANTLSQYKLAKLMLDKAILDKSWSAVTSVQGKNYENKALAVILDLDETVINNSPFSAKLIADNKYYDDEAWNNWQKWVDAAIAPAIPGALDFIKYAQKQNVTVFFVSNRIGTQEKATRKNLLSLGIYLPKDIDTVLLKKEKKSWGSKKSTRRAHIAKNYRIALLIGDNLGDFSDAYKGSLEDRDKIAFSKENIDKWGEKWIILPNPLYGSWETAAYGSDYSLSRKDIRKKMIEKLDIWDGK